MDETSADLAVIGAGSGGLTIAAAAAQLGQRVVLFEAAEMGGDCLNTGCVPSKALIAAGALAHAARASARLGLQVSGSVDFAAAKRQVEQAIATIAPHDSQARFEALGVRVVRQAASFVSARVIEGGDVRVRARRIVIASGSRPRIPEVPGLAETPFLTNETIFDLTELPRRLVVVGAGAVGMELGQAFRRLGAEVVIVEAATPLARGDAAAVRVVLEQFRNEGVEVLASACILSVSKTSDGVNVKVRSDGAFHEVEASHLLVAAGRRPNIDGLRLEAGRVAYDHRGVRTDRGLRSETNRAVYAIGDVAGREAFTHAAGAHAALVVRRELFGLPADVERLVVPRVTYTDPEIAQVGLTAREAHERYGDRARSITAAFEDNDRAVTEEDQRGFAQLVATRGGKLLGVTIVGAHAGDLIQPWVIAMTSGLSLRKMASAVPPYPTRGDVSRSLAGQWFAGRLFSPATRALVRVLKHLR